MNEATGTDVKIDTKPKDGIGICLSGGGYRAMLFHVGALWRLNEVGLLARVDRISSVSGDQYPIFMVDLQHTKYGLEDFVQQPDCVKDGAQRGCSFIIGGFMLVTFIAAAGHRPPDLVDSFCLRSSGDLLLISSRAQHIVRWWATRLRNTVKI